jgi:hypothetical protein
MASFFLGTGEEVLVEDEDFSSVVQLRWTRKAINRFKRGFYVYQQRSWGKDVVRHQMFLHRFLLSECEGVIDHIDGNTFDNRRQNLRCVSDSQNSRNRQKNTNNSSGYSGVGLKKSIGKWESRTHRESKDIYFGYYSSPDLAALARDAFIRKHDPYGRYNFPLVGERGLDGEIRVA